MQLRGGRMFLDVEQFRYFLMRLLLEHVQVEHGTTPIGKFCHKRHQHFFGKPAPAFGNTRFVLHIGKLPFTYHQLAETVLLPQIINGLCHHHPCHPSTQCTFATKGKVGEDFDKAVMQNIVRRIHIARITVAYRQHLLGIESVKFLPGGFLSCPAALYQFYLIFQCQCFFADASLRRLLVRRNILRNAAMIIFKRS